MVHRALLVAILAASAIFAGSIHHGFAQESYSVSGVEVEGYRRIDPAAIKAQLSGQSGVVTSTQINEDVKTLYNSGFFDQVTVSMVSGPSGWGMLRYVVVEKPVVRKIFIKGNDAVSESDLAEIVKIEGKRFVDKSKLQALVRKASSYYQGQGFYDATLDYSTVPVGDNEVDVTFNVTEGKRYRVREVKIQGANDLDSGAMSEDMNIKTYKWWNSWIFGTGRGNQEMRDADTQVLRP